MKTHKIQDRPIASTLGLMGEAALREVIWPDPASRPSRRWFLELKTQGLLPYRQIGRRVFYDPAEVRAAIDSQFKINPRTPDQATR